MHRLLPKIAIALLFFVQITSAVTAQEKPVITLRRTNCFGTCPVYSVEIFATGRIKYTGSQFVQITGEKTAVMSKEDVEKLVRDFLRIGYFSLQASYETHKNPDGTREMISDLPTTYTLLRIGKREKSVKDYAFAPKALIDLEWEIDRVADTHRWIDGDADDLKKRQFVQPDVYRRIKPGLTRLMQYAGEGDLHSMEQQHAAGTNVNAADETGWTALMLAASMCQVKEVTKLLSWGALVQPRDKNGDSALIGAAAAFCLERQEEQTEIIRLLIHHGADPNQSDTLGETPLMAVTKYGNVAALNLLLSSGARAGLRDRNGKSALDYARQSLKEFNDNAWTDSLKEIVAILQER